MHVGKVSACLRSPTSSGNEQFMYIGDVFHCPMTSMQHPDWTPVFDDDPAQAI
jgi:hypothetical protein